MSRPSFFSHSRRSSSARDQNPLLPQHKDDHSYPLSSLSSPRASAVSLSPPPSFYRDLDHRDSTRAYSPSPSPSRTKSPRSVQFSAPPPPIASVILPPASVRSASPRKTAHRHSNSNDPLLALERTERSIHAELQLILDAQSIGLLQGFGGEVNDGASEGSSTPTGRDRSRGGVTPVRQPRKKPIGLRGARRSLGRDIGELIKIKDEESRILELEIHRREDVLGKVKIWEERIEEVKLNISGQNRETDEEADFTELKAEEKTVDLEIRDMEDRLAQMRARKRWLGERIKEGDNRREARLSSFKGALKEVESEVERFLRRPPVSVSVVMGGDVGFTALPENRRTLGMAHEWWDKEIEALDNRRKEAATERNALEEGQKMWEECVELVNSFEDDLRVQMKSKHAAGADLLADQIAKMKKVVERLVELVEEAESKSWNLLIVAVGAELAAFEKGQELLQTTLDSIKGEEDESLSREESFHTTNDGLSSLRDLGAERTQVKRDSSSVDETSEDDGPDLNELLVERASGHSDGVD